LANAGEQPQLVARFWQAVETDLDAFTASAWASSLDHVGTFLNVAKQHGRDTAPLWALLESQPDKLAASAWTASLMSIGSYLKCAQSHGRNTDRLERELENKSHRLSIKGVNADIRSLGTFAIYAPNKLLEIAIRDVKPGHWRTLTIKQAMNGATWLILNCARVNRNDLADDLLSLLLRRANWRDFPPQSGGYAQVCWLLANVPAAAIDLVEPFLRAVCTERWLQMSFDATGCGQLASGLRQLAMNQPVERCR
jgi:hypothetical protein